MQRTKILECHVHLKLNFRTSLANIRVSFPFPKCEMIHDEGPLMMQSVLVLGNKSR